MYSYSLQTSMVQIQYIDHSYESIFSSYDHYMSLLLETDTEKGQIMEQYKQAVQLQLSKVKNEYLLLQKKVYLTLRLLLSQYLQLRQDMMSISIEKEQLNKNIEHISEKTGFNDIIKLNCQYQQLLYI